MTARVVALALLGLSLVACSKPKPVPYVWNLPEGLTAPPVVPDDNPMSAEKVTLGRYLFYDKRLSGNGTYACGSCHKQSLGFTDGLGTAVGSTGAHLARGSMALANAAYNDYYGWANPLLTTLETQMQVPMFSDQPIELGVSGHEEAVLARFAADPMYDGLFASAFPDERDPYTLANVIRAIACFERTLISGGSAWDVAQNGGTPLSTQAAAGYALFTGERFDCYHCHQPTITFASGQHTSANTSPSTSDFRNDAIYNIGGNGGYPSDNPGLQQFTGLSTDEGKFRAPSLRNIMMTAPYFHDGSAATIDDVLASYAAGGRTIASGPDAGVGSQNPNRDPFVHGFTPSVDDLTNFKAFLDSLTDTAFLDNPDLSDPFATN